MPRGQGADSDAGVVEASAARAARAAGQADGPVGSEKLEVIYPRKRPGDHTFGSGHYLV